MAWIVCCEVLVLDEGRGRVLGRRGRGRRARRRPPRRADRPPRRAAPRRCRARRRGRPAPSSSRFASGAMSLRLPKAIEWSSRRTLPRSPRAGASWSRMAPRALGGSRASSLKVEQRDAAAADRVELGLDPGHRAPAVAVHEAQVHAVARQLVGGGEAEAARATEDQRPRTFRQRDGHQEVLISPGRPAGAMSPRLANGARPECHSSATSVRAPGPADPGGWPASRFCAEVAVVALFRKVLVANRGEIAVRVIRTCRVLGIPTVAVYSEADRAARHVREADEAVAIGPAEARRSYLSIDALLAAARETGADADPPRLRLPEPERRLRRRGGRDAGLVFVGPPGDVHRRMGDKKAARRLMAAAGVPVLPGYDGDDQADATLLAEARRTGFPLMLKPSRGGGGKGMRVVRERGGLPRRARRLAPRGAGGLRRRRAGARALRRAPAARRGAGAGRRATAPCVHLGERECSVQRRHQKVVEETPSPALAPAQREALCAAGVAAARAAGYVNAGTVEFLLSPDGSLLLPRDEHAAPGRAPGDGGRHRARPRAAPARGGGGTRPVAGPGGRRGARARPRVPPLRRGPAATTTCPPRAACSTSRSPRGRASASTRGSTRAPRSPSTTTRSSRRS